MKQFAVLLLALFLLPITGFSQQTDQNFPDVSGTRSSDAVRFLKDEEVVEGYQDGTFRPEQQITRVEFLKIALEASDLTEKDCSGAPKDFPDVQSGEWFYDIVCTALKNEIVDGYPDGKFRPHTLVNFAEASKIIARIEELDADESEGEKWYQEYVDALHQERVIPGTVDSDDKNITRGDMSEIIWGIKTGNEVENESLGDVPQIESCSELAAQLKKHDKRQNLYYGSGSLRQAIGIDEFFDANFAFDAEEAGVEAPAPLAAQSKSTVADDFSTTNIQEFGVDEADIIKNDGSHIYMVKGNTVRIVRAYTPDNLEQVAILTLDEDQFSPSELYLDGDILTVIGRGRGDFYALRDTTARRETTEVSLIAPDYYPQQNALKVISFDISRPENPKKIRSVSFDGNYISSRKIGDIVYVVANKYSNYYGGVPVPLFSEADMPAFKDSAHEDEFYIAPCNRVRYFPNFQDANFLIVAAINTKDTSEAVQREVILGSSEEVYASTENLYITRSHYDEVYFEDTFDTGWRNSEFTEIFKFRLDGSEISFEGKGRAEGRILNQFSLSEYNDHLRIATQKGEAWGRDLSENLVTILDADLKQVGQIDGIAPGENIKSVRFMGNRGYLVTFKTVDPLFVIDMNPNNPRILGKLKIPGWSDYLHPYDEDHLIGFGKEVDESIDADKVHSDNAIYYTAVLGMKISIFDVSDVNNPKETHKEVIGYRGTTSELLNNHKALLFDKSKNLLAFPVTVTENKNDKVGYDADVQTVFSGAYVYDIDLDDGFTLKGKVSHYNDNSSYLKSGEYFYGSPDFNIQRMIYIGEYLYSISQNIIKALDWDDISEVNSIMLDEKDCDEIWDASECSATSSCRAIFSTSGCYEDNGEMICTGNEEFERCEEK